jgi:hypothetical protein
MKNKAKLVIMALITAGLLIGCGSSGSSSQKVNYYNGYLVDSAIAGVSWSCGGVSGITGADGKFGVCPNNVKVTFKVGNLVLGSSEPTGDLIFTTQDLVGASRSETDNQNAIRLATTLLSMDSDGDPSNGIQITEEAIVELNKLVPEGKQILDLSEEEADKVIDGIVESNPNVDKAPTPEEVQQHLQDTNSDIADGTQPAGSMERRPIQDESTN